MEEESKKEAVTESGYEKMIKLFEQVKDTLEEKDLRYAVTLINEYDRCRSKNEAEEIEKSLIRFCKEKLN